MKFNRAELARWCSFPLIAFYYYTGEHSNPWTCENCVKRGTAKAPPANASRATCCGGCGIDL